MVISPEWLTALGTLGLALTAFLTIFRDIIRDWFTRPKFSVLFEPGHPDCHLVRLDWATPTSSGSADTHYVRCRVKNLGRAGARDVEVAVTEVRQKNAAGSFRPLRTSSGCILRGSA